MKDKKKNIGAQKRKQAKSLEKSKRSKQVKKQTNIARVECQKKKRGSFHDFGDYDDSGFDSNERENFHEFFNGDFERKRDDLFDLLDEYDSELTSLFPNSLTLDDILKAVTEIEKNDSFRLNVAYNRERCCSEPLAFCMQYLLSEKFPMVEFEVLEKYMVWKVSTYLDEWGGFSKKQQEEKQEEEQEEFPYWEDDDE